MQKKRKIRKARKIKFLRNLGTAVLSVLLVVAMMVGMFPGSETHAADTAIADDSTADNWAKLNYNEEEGRTTKNDGRIWTDKSVFTESAEVLNGEKTTLKVEKDPDSDFLVGLSALSSTISVSGVSEKPLDIIMVLDVSGSMDESMGYDAVYADEMIHQGMYYVSLNNSYTQIKYSYNRNAWYYETRNGQQWITPKESADDTTSDRVQVYEQVTKMNVLADSVKNFVDTTKTNNENISSADMQHRISIVKFSGNMSNITGNTIYNQWDNGNLNTYNHSQVVKGFTTPSNEDTAESLKDAVDSLAPAGATRADYGMQVAQGLMSDVRPNAQPVVIFFTDGIPTTFSAWNDNVARDAIGAAKDMKDDGAWIYSVGVFKQEDLTNNSYLENYMQAVSSNYPEATGFTAKTMGDRVSDGDYYSTAADADELKAIFEEIAEEISGKSAEMPTYIEEGYDADKGGYVTFVDELGAYMEVTSFKSVVFEGLEYENKITDAAWDAAINDTDVFVNDAKVTNDLGAEVEIGSVVVTVERSDDISKGDIITVKVPAALVPLAYYKVTINDNGAVTERIPTTPIRAFYEVSVKDGVDELLADPDADMAAYLADNTDEDGKALFYSNAFDKDANKEIGSTIASFVPSKINDMYFAVEDTYIFMDEACTVPVTRINESATYYYQRVYYVESNTPIDPKYELVSFPASILENVGYAFNDEGYLYVKAGNARYTRADAIDTAKAQGANKTNTAIKAAAPRWENWNVPNSAVPVYLGNNGLIKKDVPGTLLISKEVVVPTWSEVDVADKAFEFEVTLKDGNKALKGTFKAQIKDADGKNVGDAFNVVTDEEGSATVTLKDGQALYIYGLADGVTYKVRETSSIEGFEQSAPADDSGQPINPEGTITSGKINKAEFENTYSAIGTLKGETYLNGTKVLSGRKWRETDIFAFALAPENANNPMPSNTGEVVEGMSIVTVSGKDSEKTFNFDDITYTESGTYLYNIREVIIDGTADRVMGVSYSQDVYEVTVVVSDNGNGTLTATSTMKKFGSDTNTDSAEFTNTFETGKVSFGIVGLKNLNDTVGTYNLKDGDFTFQLSAKTEGAPMPEGTVDGVYTTTNDGVSVSFGTIDCTLSKEEIESTSDKEVTYIYEVKEVAGEKTGMTYDSNIYEVAVTFTWDDADGLLYKITYPGTDKWVTFTNTYDPKDVTVELEGIKYLNGREWKGNETFNFVLEGLDGAPMPEEAKGNSTYEFAVNRTDDKLNIGIFGQFITFDEPGTYEYTLSEAAGNAGGITYDDYVSKITVKVTDVNGELKAEKTVSARTDIEVEAGVSGFVNKYNANETYPGLTVNKTLYGRDMSFGEFDFTIEPVNPNAKTKGIAETDASFESGAHEAGETCVNDGKLSSLKFTQDEAGKEFIYKINEVLPEDDDAQHDGIQSNGVTYDNTEYWVIIVPKDNDNGTMDVTTTIYTDEARENKVGEWNTAATDTTEPETPEVSFVNEYGFKDVTVDTKTTASITKVFKGREWLEDDTFTFKMSVAEGSETDTPMPEGITGEAASVTVGKPADGGNSAVVDFGSITFTKAGTYKYIISEINDGGVPNVSYDDHEALLTITVTDNGRGNLVASTVVEGATFTNTYNDEVIYGEITTLDVTKSLEGRELREGQFNFKVVPRDIPSMNKAGMKTLEGITFRNGAPGEDGISHMFSPDQLVFDQDDLGITYAYTFAEIDDGAEGYTYDSNVYTLEMKAVYEDGYFEVNTVVKDQNGQIIKEAIGYDGISSKPVVTIAFENTYDGEQTAQVFEGNKTMTGRNLVGSDFEFVLAYAADPEKKSISTVSNAPDGDIVFSEQTYSLESLAELVEKGYATKASDGMVDTYTISYIAFEKAGDSDSITHTESTFAFTVTVVDNGTGKLTSTTSYPESGLAFKNEYKSAPTDYNVKGLKVLKCTDGLTPDSIEGKFTFKIEALTEGAPMPEDIEVKNDAHGNVDFGNIEFDLHDLEGVDQDGKVRTKTFEYSVTETGNVPGVTNDSDKTKTFSITVTDDGEGSIAAVADPAEGPLFTFTNTYEADDVTESITGEGNLTVTKKLDGREMKAEEFKFELVEMIEENEKVIARGTNAVNGTVAFEAVTYEEPGTHTYVVREVKGDAAGVTYDEKIYQVKADVTDNGKGKLEVEFSIIDDGVTAIEFTNKYEPSQTSLAVNFGKLLEGRDLVAGEFEFEMKPVTDGAPMPELEVVANTAEGEVNFGQITYDKEGTWEYTVAEIEGDVENVIYDETVHTMKVVVTDNKDGQLELTVTFDGKEEVPVFVNKYNEPEEPTVPEEPDDSKDGDGSTKTGDSANIITYLFTLLASLIAIFVALIVRRRNSYRR